MPALLGIHLSLTVVQNGGGLQALGPQEQGCDVRADHRRVPPPPRDAVAIRRRDAELHEQLLKQILIAERKFQPPLCQPRWEVMPGVQERPQSRGASASGSSCSCYIAGGGRGRTWRGLQGLHGLRGGGAARQCKLELSGHVAGLCGAAGDGGRGAGLCLLHERQVDAAATLLVGRGRGCRGGLHSATGLPAVAAVSHGAAVVQLFL
mmetsp:Transcript_23884/g.66235  ORF Transcript_23884/g.66235 Transcript_23884/m.66235 type:complete len:207 (+) Transcript_23884:541-1161(+)